MLNQSASAIESLVKHLDVVNDRHDAMYDLVLELCNQNSGTMNLEGMEKVKQKLVEAFQSLGGEVKCLDCGPRVTIDENGNKVEAPLGQAIHISKRPNAEKKALLCIHMDTVYSVENPFQQCRMLDSGMLNGPGVADAKGGLVVMLEALRAFEASPLAEHLGWEVLINPDEEIGSPGSIPLINEIAPRCDFGLLFEPAIDDETLISWRKGSGSFAITVRGRAAHAGRDFQSGRNAIVAASKIAVELDALNTDPAVTYNVGNIRGGEALNVVPDLCIVRVNIRVPDSEKQKMAESKLEALVEKYDKLDGIAVSLFGQFSSPPKPQTDEMQALQDRIETCGKALGMPLKWQGTGGASDGNKFSAAGLPNIDSLGPVGGKIHSDNEYMNPKSLVPRAKLSALILLSYAAEFAS